MGYRLLKKLADEHHCDIIPVDSEHAGLFQLIQRIGRAIISELTITASGGPFRKLSIDQLSSVTADDACKHPVWKMGRKISIDAATMANKGLELIEAARLFDMPQTSIRVLIHPQSYIHAMVRTLDGALYAQISKPDMRLPIHMALSWPNTTASSFGFTDLVGQTLEFYEPQKRDIHCSGLRAKPWTRAKLHVSSITPPMKWPCNTSSKEISASHRSPP